jgi:creatinine amidohydrolase
MSNVTDFTGNPSRWIHQMSWPQIAEFLKRSDTVLVPIGATEQHGLHTPLMVDTGWAVATCEETAKRADILIAPPTHFGWSSHHMGYAGCITLRPETLTQVALDIGESLAYHGFKKIIFVNGNRIANLPPLDIAAAKLRTRTGAFVAIADVSMLAREEFAQIAESAPGGLGHGGESETSLMLAYWPDLVDMEKAVSVFPPVRKYGPHLNSEMRTEANGIGNRIQIPHEVESYTASNRASGGTSGDARSATADKGLRMVEALARNLAEFVAEIAPRQVTLKSIPVPI